MTLVHGVVTKFMILHAFTGLQSNILFYYLQNSVVTKGHLTKRDVNVTLMCLTASISISMFTTLSYVFLLHLVTDIYLFYLGNYL